ncbi:SDR family NAD(P)-dependent oxidoreductase [Defluviimonas salinarum]|uniref:SDR family oxidoreductase n=1 Tax=Defluviimonas salinarum TaxID=2992147 RepID=A0ABT3J3G8_9RHOB|nr:SDR family oxidoreductase [Defluviimonas salinarum]MCW3782237.1 SDR family oxidoreductase [Defluviimonas salinarum]
MAAKWTLITGASDGLGREFARIAAAEGRDLILVARRAERLESLAQELRARHRISVEVMPADLSDPAAVDALWRRAAHRRQIEVLVNDAGFGLNGAFAETDLARELASIAVNVMALTILMKHAVGHMRSQGGGRILNVGSTAGFMPGPNMAVYHATKAYVLSLSEAVAEELRGGNVTVTALCPGATATGFQSVAQMENALLLRVLPVAEAGAVARAGWRAMQRGRRICVTGSFNRFFAAAPRLSPRALTTRIAGLFLRSGGIRAR